MKTVTVKFGELELRFDPDRHWQSLLSMAPCERLRVCRGDYYWLVALQCMQLPAAVLERFWKEFQTPEAARERDIAVEGLVVTNRRAVQELVDAARHFKTCRETDLGLSFPDLLTEGAERVAVGFSDIVAAKDEAALRRIIQIINGEVPAPRRARGGVDSERGRVWQAFVDLHAELRSLPTKAALRARCGMSGLAFEKTATEIFKKLGLHGLPTKKRTPS